MTNIYDRASQFEKKRCESDVIYHCIHSRDLTVLNSMLKEIQDLLEKEYGNRRSPRMIKFIDRTVKDNDDRAAKHAFLFWGLCMFLDYAKNLVQPADNSPPKVNPEKFVTFYKVLPTLVNNLLVGEHTSLREFAEKTRTVYILGVPKRIK